MHTDASWHYDGSATGFSKMVESLQAIEVSCFQLLMYSEVNKYWSLSLGDITYIQVGPGGGGHLVSLYWCED